MNKYWFDVLIPFLVRWEGLKLTAYQCSANVWTIGIGSTMYPDGTRVEPGDVCTKEEAYEYCKCDLRERAAVVMPMIKNDEWTEGAKFAMLMSLAYNIGTTALRDSTALARINNHADDGDIAEAWSWWNKANGVTVAGLVNRRNAEIDVAFS